ncbi:hypothetical protein [Elizabethkingia anophelis]|uniref:hypothetical protein n=1 Tax=Elizabethkingia anophelis TaxID=1117645 RepID=UPI0024E1FB52|nr:hypothetical protein [Elizabethkingia anophelis]CAH1143502.1 hypothetical protein EAVNVB490_01399 [Elizabethkingia anophelis]CAI9670325.1 hypothetical protein EAVNNN508_01398 [Elizabethkingia anophelis]CAI9673399.1 hypothetical protein EAVNVB490_00764 [Elizabethkingia anophelis]CAI9678710.1 hypothetical protein EAVNNN508_00762 [Elizabethkingia anophelis]
MKSLIKLDELTFHYHSYLVKDNDDCFYFYDDYLPSVYDNPTNSLIANYKKKINVQPYLMRYKDEAIKKVANMIRYNFENVVNNYTLIPIPPSKQSDHEEYDDRNTKTLKLAFGNKQNIEIKEYIITSLSHDSFHNSSTDRKSPDELYEHLDVDEREKPTNKDIILFDDLLTTGCHFKACQKLILEKIPEAKVRGLFIARRKINEAVDDFFDFDDFFSEL